MARSLESPLPCHYRSKQEFLAALATAAGEAQLASNDRQESRQRRERAANQAAHARDREHQDRCALALLELQLNPNPDSRIQRRELISLLHEAIDAA